MTSKLVSWRYVWSQKCYWYREVRFKMKVIFFMPLTNNQNFNKTCILLFVFFLTLRHRCTLSKEKNKSTWNAASRLSIILYLVLKTGRRNFCSAGHELNWVPPVKGGADPAVLLRLALRWNHLSRQADRQADGATYLLLLRPLSHAGWLGKGNWRISTSFSPPQKKYTQRELSVSHECTCARTHKRTHLDLWYLDETDVGTS